MFQKRGGPFLRTSACNDSQAVYSLSDLFNLSCTRQSRDSGIDAQESETAGRSAVQPMRLKRGIEQWCFAARRSPALGSLGSTSDLRREVSGNTSYADSAASSHISVPTGFRCVTIQTQASVRQVHQILT